MSEETLAPIEGSGRRLFLTILAIVFATETLVMLGLSALPGIGGVARTILDASLLTLVLAPFLWRGVVRPLRRQTFELTKVAERKILQLNRVYALLSDVNQAIVRIRDPDELFSEACRIAVETGGFQAAWIGQIEEKTGRLQPVAGMSGAGAGVNALGAAVRDLGPEAGVSRTGKRDVRNHIEDHRDDIAWRAETMARGYRASAVFPLRVNGKTLGTLSLYAGVPGLFNDEELRLLDEMAADISFAMEMAGLEEVRQRLATAVAESPVSVVITTLDGQIEYVNPAFTQMTGYPPEEALGGNPRLLKSGAQGEALYRELWDTIKRGESWHGELVNRRKDGSLYTQETTIAPIREGPVVRRFVAISQDVTERRQASERMRLQSAALGAAANAVMITDRGGRIVWVNEAFTRLTAWSEEECRGLKPAILKSGQHPRPFYAELWRTILGGEVWQHEMVNRRKDGSLYVEDQTITPVRDDRGEITHFVAIKIDIGERKRAEEALQDAETRYRALFEQSPNGVLVVDALTGKTIEANEAASRQLGYSPREFAEMRISDYEVTETPEETQRHIRRVLDGGSEGFETQHRTRSGELRNMHVFARRFELAGRPALHCIFEDITGRKQAEARLLLAMREQEALLKEVHHRVKNNLQVITSLLRLESSRIELPSTKAVLKDVQNRIQSMALLHESLYRSGQFAEVHLAAYFRLLAGNLARSLTTLQGQVELRLELADLRVGLDQAIPCGLIVNELLSNAFKHAFPDGRRGVVWVELSQVSSEDLRLCVRDDGIGIPTDFEARRAQSLGLQLVGDLVRQLRGRMETTSGAGSAFEVTFKWDHSGRRAEGKVHD